MQIKKWLAQCSEAHCVALLIVLAPIVLPLWKNRPEIDISASLLFGSLGILCWLSLRYKKLEWTVRPFHIAVFAVFGWGVFSFIWGINNFLWFNKIIFWLNALVLLVVAMLSVRTSKQIQIVLMGVFISGTAVAFIGLLQYYFDISWYQQASKPAASFGNKNMASHYVIFTVFTGMAFAVQSKTAMQHSFWLLQVVLQVTFLIVATTRSTWVAGLIQSVFFAFATLYLVRHKKLVLMRYWKLDGIAVVLVVFLIQFDSRGLSNKFAQYGNEWRTIAQNSQLGSKKMSERYPLWLNSLYIVKDYPLFGVGLGEWRNYYPAYQQRRLVDHLATEHNQPLKAHNDIIEFWVELGSIGLLLLLAMIFIPYYSLWKNWREMEVKAAFDSVVITTNLLGLAIVAQFSFPMQLPLTLSLALLLLHCLTILSLSKQWHLKTTAIGLNFARVVVICSTVILFKIFTMWYQSDKYFIAAKNLESGTAFERIAQYGIKSQQIFPWRTEAQFFVAYSDQHLGRHKEALDKYKQILQDFPYSSSALLRAAQSALIGKNPKEAIPLLERLQYNRPHSAEVYKHYGILYYNFSANKKLAAQYFAKALQYDPNMEQAEQLRKIVQKYHFIE